MILLIDNTFFIPLNIKQDASLTKDLTIIFLLNPAIGTDIVINWNKVNCGKGGHHCLFLDKEIIITFLKINV
jgi:hypothetical protein